MRAGFVIVLAAVVLGLSGARCAEETTQSYLVKYGDKLAEAWFKYPLEKDALIRKQRIADLTQNVNNDIKQLDAPKDVTISKILNSFFSNLERSRSLFKAEKMNAEKASYIAACGEVFKRELPFATDIDMQRTGHKCFELLANWSDDARARMRTIPEEAHNAIFSNLNDAFMLIMKSAVKDEGDATSIYELELKDVQKRCPVSAPTLAKINQPAKAMLESAAKKVLDLNKK